VKQKVIVCDDDDEILDITAFILEDAGYDVIKVPESVKVIDTITETNPALVILDLWMPGMSGDEVVIALRKNDQLKHTNVIIISASRDGKQTAMQAGADQFIAKPYDLEHLVAEVRKFAR